MPVGSRRQVLNGTVDRTTGGLDRSDLTVNKRNRIVSRKKITQGRKQFKNVSDWNKLVTYINDHTGKNLRDSMMHAKRMTASELSRRRLSATPANKRKVWPYLIDQMKRG
eukprot:jgi/Mesvir1/19556/Mv18075-RA.1